MIAVLGGSAEIIGWPGKVVLCAAEVSISIRISTGFSDLSDTKKNFYRWSLSQRSVENPSPGLSTGSGKVI